MTVTLTPDQEKVIADLIKSGVYCSIDDVIAESLRMLQDHEEFIRANTTDLREKISVGVEQIKRGEVLDGREVFDRILGKNPKRPRS
ncbi:MAG TPA: type II toxin-antitoxin system ParD family antitoxin [Verrucomicrobiae bacterium]|nr:type II toxin-antitoxin system ParD family antitoxin [Verrucomicrobiae bacterium]